MLKILLTILMLVTVYSKEAIADTFIPTELDVPDYIEFYRLNGKTVNADKALILMNEARKKIEMAERAGLLFDDSAFDEHVKTVSVNFPNIDYNLLKFIIKADAMWAEMLKSMPNLVTEQEYKSAAIDGLYKIVIVKTNMSLADTILLRNAVNNGSIDIENALRSLLSDPSSCRIVDIVKNSWKSSEWIRSAYGKRGDELLRNRISYVGSDGGLSLVAVLLSMEHNPENVKMFLEMNRRNIFAKAYLAQLP